MIPTINHLAPNQTIITYTDGTSILYSYSSFISRISPDGSVLLGADWDFSHTTSKYRSKFLNESTTTTRAKLANGTYTLKRDT